MSQKPTGSAYFHEAKTEALVEPWTVAHYEHGWTAVESYRQSN